MSYRRHIFKGALFLVNAHLLLVAGVSTALFLALLMVLAAVHLFADWRNLTLLTVTFISTALLAEAALRIYPLDAGHYRPHDRLSAFDSEIGSRYERNVSIEMMERHGDLMAFSPAAPRSLWQPRRVTFTTDSRGFRNNDDYRGQAYIFIGDSFVAGLGNSQEDLLSERIRELHGIEAYNMAHPGEPEYYAKLIAAANSWFKTDRRLILFLFEGNDFPEPVAGGGDEAMSPAAYLRWYYRRYREIFAAPVSDTKIYQIWRGLYGRVRVLAQEYFSGVHNAIILRIGPRDVAFSRAYSSDTRRPDYNGYPGFDRDLRPVLPSVSLIVFIPSKYRVYYDATPPNAEAVWGADARGNGGQALPDAQWSYVEKLSREFDIPAINLTRVLRAESRRLLAQGDYTFWRDDSHWNAHGIRVAAGAVARALAALPGSAPARPIDP